MNRRALIAGIVASAAQVQPAQAKGFLALTTRDAGRLIAWYKTHFDLKLIRTVRPPNANLTIAILDGPVATVEILARSDARPADPQPERRVGFFKAGFQVDKLDPWVARWRAAGLIFAAGPFDDDQPPLRSVILSDPDGNLVHITAPLPSR
jgi:catechol 2,3-dioxygenase-like lactoylglutathione lyase family enzyme